MILSLQDRNVHSFNLRPFSLNIGIIIIRPFTVECQFFCISLPSQVTTLTVLPSSSSPSLLPAYPHSQCISLKHKGEDLEVPERVTSRALRSQVQIAPSEIHVSGLVSCEGELGLSPRTPGTPGKSLPHSQLQ